MAIVSGAIPNGPQFDLGRLVSSFEQVTFPIEDAHQCAEGGLPHTAKFLDAMSEVVLLFDHLGTAFTFVRRDIESKTFILRTYAQEHPSRFPDLQTAVNCELAEGTVAEKPPPSAARTLLRLMWALKFIDVLLARLRETLDPNCNFQSGERTLRAAVSVAYDSALAEHHSWALRRTVRTALTVLPSMESFVKKIGARPSFLERLKQSMTPIVKTMYRFYESNDLLDLP